MKVSLGPAKLPFEGDLNLAGISAGAAFGAVMTALAFNYEAPQGPGLDSIGADSKQFIAVMWKTILASVLWCVVYQSLVGVTIGTNMNIHMLELYKSTDVTDKYASNASRFPGRTMEQAPLFLVSLWSYSLVCDSVTGGNLGLLYALVTALYPLGYIYCGRFTFWFEFLTQPGYGVCGTFMLGLIIVAVCSPGAAGNAWISYVNNTGALAPVLGWLFGFCNISPFPLNPYAALVGLLHYKTDNARRKKDPLLG